jgi:glycolate oxidase iron-sulfur subunit
MQAQLTPTIGNTAAGKEAADIVRSCVHCGFCTATCPTYQLLGDELDGPRGRIYLIKQVLEGHKPTASTQQHLDRCLTCRGCETTCPSGVQYGRLLDIGREMVETQVPRSFTQRLLRRTLASFLTGPAFAPALKLGQWLRPVLPAWLAEKVPQRRAAGTWPQRQHARRMLLLGGCVQPAMSPNIHAATARVFDALGIGLVIARKSGCCGAIAQHLSDPSGALDQARHNIDAWWPEVEAGIEAIVVNASGCGTQLRDYGHLLRHDGAYALKAARISALARDPVELLAPLVSQLAPRVASSPKQRIAFHPPCSLQHGLKIRGEVEKVLISLGAELLPVNDSHLCCGSAGTYSLLQSDLSTRLRDAKTRALTAHTPELILSANIGCIQQIAGATAVPVRHWLEWVDERLSPPSAS